MMTEKASTMSALRRSFAAIARTPDGRFEQRERSRFLREAGHWRYVDGVELG